MKKADYTRIYSRTEFCVWPCRAEPCGARKVPSLVKILDLMPDAAKGLRWRGQASYTVIRHDGSQRVAGLIVAGFPECLTMLNLEQLFDKTHLMPTIPKVVQELIESFSNEDIDIEAIARKVALDQVLTAKVLRLANSSYYGLQRKIGSVDEALVVMGLNSLRTLVVATGVTGAFAPIPGFDRAKFWRRSLVVAAYARWLAKKAGLNGELAFTAGLMHAIGEILIHLALPDEMAVINGRLTAGGQRVEVEREMLGFSHCEVGAELARRWCFPADIQEAILNYSAPLVEQPVAPYAVLVHLAAWLARSTELGADELRAQFPQEVAAVLDFTADSALQELPSAAEISAGLDAFLSS